MDNILYKPYSLLTATMPPHTRIIDAIFTMVNTFSFKSRPDSRVPNTGISRL